MSSCTHSKRPPARAGIRRPRRRRAASFRECSPASLFSTVRPICTSTSAHRRSSASARSVSAPTSGTDSAAGSMRRQLAHHAHERVELRAAGGAVAVGEQQARGELDELAGVSDAAALPRAIRRGPAEPAQALAEARVQSGRQRARADRLGRLQRSRCTRCPDRACGSAGVPRRSTLRAIGAAGATSSTAPSDAGRVRDDVHRRLTTPASRRRRRQAAGSSGTASRRRLRRRRRSGAVRSVGSTRWRAAAAGRTRRIVGLAEGRGDPPPDAPFLPRVVDDDADDEQDAGDDEAELERTHAHGRFMSRRGDDRGESTCAIGTRV